MTDGRVYTIEDEIDVMHEDLGKARRRREQLLSAKHDGRMVNEPEIDQAIGRLEDLIRVFERDLAEAYAERIAAAEGFVA